MLLKSFYAACLAALLGPFCMGANANLIVNGGFEDNKLATGQWGYFQSANVNGWEGDNIELWNRYGGVRATEGNQHAELNAHPFDGTVFSIYQSFATIIGQTYDVSFFYSARVNSNEQFYFGVNNLSVLLNDHLVGSWKQYTGSFVAENLVSRISFTTYDAGTMGNFLDDVVVTTRVHLVESNPLLLLLIGLTCLILARLRNNS